MAASGDKVDFGWKAPAFELPATDGKTYSLDDIRGERGLLVMFICNHCPYVRAIIDKIVRDASELRSLGIGSVAINANDATAYPDDSFENMKIFAAQNDFSFPYLHDESQVVAKAYNAVCTPDYFGFNGELGLQYRGRLDESGISSVPSAKRELFEAMKRVAETGHGPEHQTPSIGCSIKWKHL